MLTCFASLENVNKCHSTSYTLLYCILTLFNVHIGVSTQLMRKAEQQIKQDKPFV